MIGRRTIPGFLLGLMVSPLFGQTAGMVSFQGLIKDSMGNPITVPVDLEFRIYDAQTLGNLVDMDGDGAIEDICGQDVTCVSAVTPTNGIVFTKFGPIRATAFDGNDRFLEVRVDGTPLSRIEMVTAPATSEQVNIPPTGTPAIHVDASGNVGIGTTSPNKKLDVDGNAIIRGGLLQIGTNTLSIDSATNSMNASGNIDVFVNAAAPATGDRALRLEGTTGTPNVIGGHNDNSAAGAVGATIAGGGNAASPNRVTADFGTVGGGNFNTAAGGSTVSGGGREHGQRRSGHRGRRMVQQCHWHLVYGRRGRGHFWEHRQRELRHRRGGALGTRPAGIHPPCLVATLTRLRVPTASPPGGRPGPTTTAPSSGRTPPLSISCQPRRTSS